MHEGLRERKKQATRRALGEAALRLALEHGPDNVRVEDIAALAGVSARTYNNYFSSREAAICSVSLERAHRLADGLRARPEGEPLDVACVEAFLAHYREGQAPDQRVMQMIFSHPALHGEFIRSVSTRRDPLAEAIAERCGLDPRHDPFPALLSATLNTAARIACRFWLEHAPDRHFHDVLRESLVRVAPVAASFEQSAR